MGSVNHVRPVARGARPGSSFRGFTITEVIISVGLLAVALLAVIGLFTSTIKMQSQSQERAEATYLVRQLMDRIRATPDNVPAAPRTWIGGELAFDPLDAGPPTFPPSPYPFRRSPTEGYNEGYALDVILEEFPANPDLKLVRVVARWDNGKRRLALQTLIRN